MGERQSAPDEHVEDWGADLARYPGQVWRWFARPRAAGLLWTYVFMAAVGALMVWNQPERATASDSFGTFVGLSVSVTVVSAVLAFALLTKPHRWHRPLYVLVGICWHGLAGFVLILAIRTTADVARGEALSFGLLTMWVAAVSVAIIALALNRSLFELQTSADPPAEAVAYIVSMHALLLLVLLAITYGTWLERFSTLVNEVISAGVTGLTVLGIPTSLAVLVVLRRHRIRAEAPVSFEVPPTPTPAPVQPSALMVAAYVVMILTRRR